MKEGITHFYIFNLNAVCGLGSKNPKDHDNDLVGLVIIRAHQGARKIAARHAVTNWLLDTTPGRRKHGPGSQLAHREEKKDML